MTRPGLERGPPDPESNALTMRPLHFNLIFSNYSLLSLRQGKCGGLMVGALDCGSG